MPRARAEPAPAKVNLTLHVIARRPDGYHDIESLVAFAEIGDALSFTLGRDLALAVRGPTAAASGDVADNLVLKAARALAERVEGLKLGRFMLTKRLPVAAGLGGGSTDAAAALRLLARANRLPLDDPRLREAARATGADVPVCLDPRPRVMRGIGDILSDPLDLPALLAVLVNPNVAVPTRNVFAALSLPRAVLSTPSPLAGEDWGGGWRDFLQVPVTRDRSTPTRNPPPQGGGERTELVATLAAGRNDLEAPAIKIQPAIAHVLAALRKTPSCRLARMSGSGATCFGLFVSARAAVSAARALRAKHPDWWIRATVLAG